MIENLPQSSGVYLFKDGEGRVIYIGKAANIKRRVSSYYKGKRDTKTERIAKSAKEIDFIETETVLEALIEEAHLIKKHKPYYNIKEKDDRSFLYVVITKEEYPRVLLLREREIGEARSVFGPFVFSSEIRSAMKVIRKIFPFSTHKAGTGKPCFHYQLGLCPGTCTGEISKKDYMKEIRSIELFFKGKKETLISQLKKEMKKASSDLEFERAQDIKRKIDSLVYIQDTVLLKKKKNEGVRIEGYDISNISGKLAVGAMAVFSGDVPLKKEYRMFKIKGSGKGDIEMIKEVIKRRLKRDWERPSLILVDGGLLQMRSVEEALDEEGVEIPVVASVKGEKARIIGKVPFEIKKNTLLHLQEEAHRFALNYHRKLREKEFYGDKKGNSGNITG